MPVLDVLKAGPNPTESESDGPDEFVIVDVRFEATVFGTPREPSTPILRNVDTRRPGLKL